ncbi:VF530 family DNA-binding protein [Algibacter sp. L1A34]|uniref:VF530 family protein n=1 Tax=Algibacter sp. L1A34 TaxID=2686365 RepID=UPI00131CB713|nr:VF530 family protein [Algibacter sp. L1A34]
MKIKQVSLQDIENLKAIEKQTFRETYASVNNEEHISAYTLKKNKLANKQTPSKTLKETELQPKPKRIRRPATEEQLSNPFHGVKLKQVLEHLVAHYGWAYLGERTNLRCFIYNPTMKSSLGFLRRTTWAREHVEDLYLDMLDETKEEKEEAK